MACGILSQSRVFSVTLVLTILCGGAQAMWPESWLLGESCKDAAMNYYQTTNYDDYSSLCRDESFLGTVVQCICDHSDWQAPRADDAWIHFTYSTCEIHAAKVSDEYFQAALAYIESVGVGTASNITNPISPVRIPETQYDVAYNSVHNYLRQKDISVWQGAFLVGYFMFVMAICGAYRFVRFMSTRFAGNELAMCRPRRLMLLWNKHVTMPAMFGFRHMTKVKFLGVYMSIPTRFETLVIGVYFILHVIFDLVPYTFLKDDPLYPTHWKEMLRFASDRAGIIGVIQLPLLTLFALRNNLLIWVTGWSFSTFNTYHRAITRITYMQFIVHAVIKHIFSASYGSSLVKYFYPLPYYRWGVSAMFLMAIMIGTGSFRSRIYEAFLRLHGLCAIGAYVCIIYHLKGLGYKETIYVSFGLWLADWLIRIGRLLFVNFAIMLAPTRGSKRQTYAQMCVMNGEIVNVRVRATVLWKPRPGQYVFIHVNRLRFWEAHPFSVVGPSSDGESFQLLCKARGGMTKRFCKYLLDNGHDDKHPLTRSVFIEGPYGVHCPVERYENVMLVAGGVGITAVIPYVEYMAHYNDNKPARIFFVWVVQKRADTRWIEERLTRLARLSNVQIEIYATDRHDSSTPAPPDNTKMAYAVDQKADPSSGAPSSPASTIDLSLAARYSKEQKRALADAPADAPVDAQPDDGLVEMHRMYPSMLTLNSAEHTAHAPLRLATLTREKAISADAWFSRIHTGRPNIDRDILQFLMSSKGSACVLGCGPPPMMDSIRQSVAKHLDVPSTGRVDYFEEAYSW